MKIFETTEINGRDTHFAQRISMRRNGLRQSRVNAFDTMVAVRGSGSLEVEKSKAKVRDNDVSPEHVGDLRFDVIRSSSLIVLGLREVDGDGGGGPGHRVGDHGIADNDRH